MGLMLGTRSDAAVAVTDRMILLASAVYSPHAGAMETVAFLVTDSSGVGVKGGRIVILAALVDLP